jgi:hypothetical protein
VAATADQAGGPGCTARRSSADGRLAAYLDQRVRVDMLSVTAPHPFFVLDVDDVVAGGSDERGPAAPFAGWRYLLEVNQRVVALATTEVNAKGKHRYGGIGTGPAVSSVVYAVHIAEALLRDRPGEFRFTAIDVPAVHTVLLQVGDRRQALRAYLPIGLSTSLNPARLYSHAEIQRALLAMAERRVSEPRAGEPIGG